VSIAKWFRLKLAYLLYKKEIERYIKSASKAMGPTGYGTLLDARAEFYSLPKWIADPLNKEAEEEQERRYSAFYEACQEVLGEDLSEW
jgi:hypothetical protein